MPTEGPTHDTAGWEPEPLRQVCPPSRAARPQTNPRRIFGGSMNTANRAHPDKQSRRKLTSTLVQPRRELPTFLQLGPSTLENRGLQRHATGGVRTCEKNSETTSPSLRCRVSYPSGFFANLSSLTRQDISSYVFLPDIFALMPEVMQGLVMMAGPFNNGPIINQKVYENPDFYLKSIITSSYQGVWSTLQEGYSDGETDKITYYPISYGLLKAKLSKWRVLFWWLLNVLLTLSGGLLFWLQSGCTRDPVTDWVTTGKPLVPLQVPLPVSPVMMTNDHSFPSRYLFCPGETSPEC